MNFYITVAILNIFASILYLQFAKVQNILDKPNERSSHQYVTVRGMGIIFPISVVIHFLFSSYALPFFVIGLLLISFISYVDDLFTVRNIYRLTIHIIAVTFLFTSLSFFSYPLYIIIIVFVATIGWINAFNFMDGINGISALYSMTIFIPLFFLLNDPVLQELTVSITLSVIIFGYYNIRPKAHAFSGDVGSISLAFIIAFLLINLMAQMNSIIYILFLSVYGVDSVLTIIHRLSRRENIFQSHRSHLYQYMTNRVGMSHIYVSAIFASIQLIINLFIIFILSSQTSELKLICGMSILMALSVIYIYSKSFIERKY